TLQRNGQAKSEAQAKISKLEKDTGTRSYPRNGRRNHRNAQERNKDLKIYKEIQKASLEAQSKISNLEDGILELEAIRAMDQEIIETLKD
uniref:Uncharacterized protein n=1 Tax=Ditylenchus dipsaci TaxID=166011 RepID=A0A915D943_9BILA